MVIKAIDFKEEEIGESFKMYSHSTVTGISHIFRTKKRYLWVFEIDGKQHNVELHHSIITGRIRVFSNGLVLYDESRYYLDTCPYNTIKQFLRVDIPIPLRDRRQYAQHPSTW